MEQFKLCFSNEILVKIPTLGSMNCCYFHAVLQALNQSYIQASTQVKTELAITFKNLIAEKLESYNLNGVRIYDTLSQGTLEEYSKQVPEYSLENMLSLLRDNEPVDHQFQEIICEIMEVDIYLLAANSRDIYKLCDEEKLYIKNRKSILILYEEGHYSLVACIRDEQLITVFSPQDPLIQNIRNRIIKLS